ncbi:germin-like protein subfamily 1 member 14 [Gossypium hirsutum]|uniref:Germin-like protein n=2 Tax=Gossypium TaxID=3633 RepID=A0A1U8PE33_GOSHI|nr:germin-like protein subfamily 1 member 14 [Gossypium hirsutum]
MKGMNSFLLTFSLLALVSTLASASDSSSLQDFCVALNGTKHASMSLVHIPGLNTLGISLVRIDYAPVGVESKGQAKFNKSLSSKARYLEKKQANSKQNFKNKQGTMENNRLFTNVLKTGDVFVFPVGLIHFQFNIGKTNAIALAGLSSQNPGVISIANAVFGSKPPINPDVLTKAFKLDKEVVEYLQTQF